MRPVAHRREGLPDGRRVFVKTGPVSPLFTSEAAGLRWLGDIAATVVEAGEDHIVVEWVDTEPPTPEAAERFGRDLARTHLLGADAFGAPWPGFIAELPMDNSPSHCWPEFYARQRVLPFVRQARLPAGDVRLIEQAVERFPEVAGPAEPPARIHGDLWSGNVLWSGGRCVLIDPAAHGGHRETDLAMLALFGAPYLDRILGAYAEAAPLADGWRERVPLHQLHPLLVHVVLFGGSYRDSLMSAVRKVLSL
ncbi:fructosamine kinase family protein [Thermoactinospora rubra]|uniref:fructosamine kinase family protein n=1 Tax=Thermoactinospora rubra TaxID=1088767 RepID=UPI000A11BE8D|nr:fructosamine kinase family protein [Thermoactinospora rubra]